MSEIQTSNEVKKPQKARVIFIVILVCIVAFTVGWIVSEPMRNRYSEMSQIKEEIEAYRNGESSGFFFVISDSAKHDEKFQEFLAEQACDMYKNNEMSVLSGFLRALENDGCRAQQIADKLNALAMESGDIERALELVDRLSYMDFYKNSVKLNRNSKMISDYIRKNNSNPITKEKGEGYYADCKDKKTRDTVGLSNSPLYDASEVTYYGDFQYVHEYGVKLNQYYEEADYSRESYYFRDHFIDFCPDDGECVWSGQYLFCFNSTGGLLGFAKVGES